MATGSLTTARYARMIETDYIGEIVSGMTRRAILIGYGMRWRFASGDFAVVTVHA